MICERSVCSILKRFTAFVICLVMLIAALPVSAHAASEEEVERIEDQIVDVYRRTLSSTGTTSLHGYCGFMAAWELYLMGITTSVVSRNGNEMYDVLLQSNEIAEGYTPIGYSSAEYSLEEALNAVSYDGTKDVYNMIVGFQWTKTAAGRYYGHVTVVHAILNGQVYFTEGFMTPFQADPSQAMVCSIEEFAEYYNGWTQFDGLLHFDSGFAVAGCDSVVCDLFVAAEREVTLWSKPDFLEGKEIRTAAAGERLHATGLCRNAEGVLFYQIIENGQACYIPADLGMPVWYHDEQVTVRNGQFPAQTGTGIAVSCTLTSERLPISTAAVHIVNQAGESVFFREIPTEGTNVEVKVEDLGDLPDGVYTLSVLCDLENPYSMNGELISNLRRVTVSQSVFTVGEGVPESRAAAAELPVKNGWQYENKAWYYYEDGSCRTGWFCDNGIDYYLQENGAAATGWQEINGKNRYFTETGAMRIGWLETADGVYYMLSNGESAVGLMTVGQSQYFFNEAGHLVTDEEVELDGTVWHMDENGIATIQ